jgi:hypothetical protein
MDEPTKQPWNEPDVQPLTDTDSRADVMDAPVRNIVVGPSSAVN